jgi:hypothetical protein
VHKKAATARRLTARLSAKASKETADRMTAELEPLATEDALNKWAFSDLAKGEHASPASQLSFVVLVISLSEALRATLA